jgi:hypothetical protein
MTLAAAWTKKAEQEWNSMHSGHVTGRLSRQEATEEKVLSLAMLD